MREVKFEYIFKEKYGMNLHHRMFTIEDLENYEMDVFLLENSFEIVARRQSTNLKDKNGKEIYEGDIVKWQTKNVGGVVSVVYETTCFTLEGTGFHVGHFSLSKLEVIGNIYESPELIKTT